MNVIDGQSLMTLRMGLHRLGRQSLNRAGQRNIHSQLGLQGYGQIIGASSIREDHQDIPRIFKPGQCKFNQQWPKFRRQTI